MDPKNQNVPIMQRKEDLHNEIASDLFELAELTGLLKTEPHDDRATAEKFIQFYDQYSPHKPLISGMETIINEYPMIDILAQKTMDTSHEIIKTKVKALKAKITKYLGNENLKKALNSTSTEHKELKSKLDALKKFLNVGIIDKVEYEKKKESLMKQYFKVRD